MVEEKKRMPETGEYVRGVGTLVEIQKIIPPIPIPETDYIFEEVTATVELRLGEEVLNKIGTLWDAYGLETSVKAAIDEAKEYASKRKIGPDSELEVVVIKIVEQVRKRLKKNDENFYNPNFHSFVPPEYGSKANVADPVRTVVWSSRGK